MSKTHLDTACGITVCLNIDKGRPTSLTGCALGWRRGRGLGALGALGAPGGGALVSTDSEAPEGRGPGGLDGLEAG